MRKLLVSSLLPVFAGLGRALVRSALTSVLLCLFAAGSPSKAQIVVSEGVNNFVDEYGVNPIGIGAPIGSTGYYSAPSIYDSIAVDSVTPSAGTSVTAQQGGVVYSLSFVGGPGTAEPNEFYGNLPLDPALTGPWTLKFVNPGQSNSGLTLNTRALTVLSPPLPAYGVSLSGSLLAPTVNWSIPAGSSATAETVFVYQVTPGAPANSGVFRSLSLPPTTTSYTIPPDYLTAGDLYSFSVQSDIGVGGNGTLEARSRSFTAAFTASAETLPAPIFLPTVSPTLSVYGGPVFDFDVPVTADQAIAIDPPAATGFIYNTGAGDPNFASVELPNIGNPTPYDLYLWNGSQFVFDTTLNADTVFDFAAGGVSEFEILGIMASLGLNPNSATNFVTQLTFTGSGTFTGTMTPVIESVPEPSTWALLAVGFAGLGFAARVANSRRRLL